MYSGRYLGGRKGCRHDIIWGADANPVQKWFLLYKRLLRCSLVPHSHHVDSHTTSRALNVDNAHINRESPTVPNVNQKDIHWFSNFPALNDKSLSTPAPIDNNIGCKIVAGCRQTPPLNPRVCRAIGIRAMRTFPEIYSRTHLFWSCC